MNSGTKFIQQKIHFWVKKFSDRQQIRILRLRIFRKKLIHFNRNPILCLGIVFFCFFFLFQKRSTEEKFLLAHLGYYFRLSEKERTFLGQDDCSVPDFSLVAVGENSFRAVSSPDIVRVETLGSFGGNTMVREGRGNGESKEIVEYIVKEGDSLSSIAQKFGISLKTIQMANGLTGKTKIKPGQKLTILPVSGMMHLVEKGESLGYLAKLYQVEVSEIIEFNELAQENKIFVGDLLIIPRGKKLSKTAVSSKTDRPSMSIPLASSHFICPIPAPCTISQGLHWYNAIDFSHGKCGEPVYAVARGQIQRTGYDRMAGNYVRILHPNGVVTFYGHFSEIIVKAGQKVRQGQVIGYIGNTGYTIGRTGCHVHFEVRGGRNPFAY